MDTKIKEVTLEECRSIDRLKNLSTSTNQSRQELLEMVQNTAGKDLDVLIATDEECSARLYLEVHRSPKEPEKDLLKSAATLVQKTRGMNHALQDLSVPIDKGDRSIGGIIIADSINKDLNIKNILFTLHKAGELSPEKFLNTYGFNKSELTYSAQDLPLDQLKRFIVRHESAHLRYSNSFSFLDGDIDKEVFADSMAALGEIHEYPESAENLIRFIIGLRKLYQVGLATEGKHFNHSTNEQLEKILQMKKDGELVDTNYENSFQIARMLAEKSD